MWPIEVSDYTDRKIEELLTERKAFYDRRFEMRHEFKKQAGGDKTKLKQIKKDWSKKHYPDFTALEWEFLGLWDEHH